jgi:hypothetical protein
LVHVCKFLDKSSVAQSLDRGLKGRLHFPWVRNNSAKREMQYGCFSAVTSVSCCLTRWTRSLDPNDGADCCDARVWLRSSPDRPLCARSGHLDPVLKTCNYSKP